VAAGGHRDHGRDGFELVPFDGYRAPVETLERDSAVGSEEAAEAEEGEFAAWSPRRSRSQWRAAFALARVSSVVNVFEQKGAIGEDPVRTVLRARCGSDSSAAADPGKGNLLRTRLRGQI
jgi:hypothetical protein